VLAWYDYLFKGVQNEFATVPVRIFVMGENKYHQVSDWPPPENKLNPLLPALGWFGPIRCAATAVFP